MIYEYSAFIEVPEKLGEDKMVELDGAIAFFIEDEFDYPVEFSVVGQIDEKSGDCEIEKVVRCKDCKWSSPNGQYGCRLISDDGSIDRGLYANDFCSYGEREEE